MITPKRCIAIDTPNIDLNKMDESLDKLRFRDCLADQEESWGFYNVDESDTSSALLHRVDRYALINLRHDQKKLNKTRLSRAWRAEIERLQKLENMTFDKPRRDEIREAVKKELFKKTPPNEKYTKCVYDSIDQKLYVFESVPAAAEFLIAKLNDALREQSVSIPFKADDLQPVLSQTLTEWVANPELPEEQGFEVGENMTLLGDESAKATLAHHNPESGEVREHLHSGKEIERVLLFTKDEQGNEISFVLSSKRVLSQIDLKAVCTKQIHSERENHTDIKAMKDAELLIWMAALSELVKKVSAIKEV